MSPTLTIQSNANELSGLPREALCSVWPMMQKGNELEIGEPIFHKYMVLINTSLRYESKSILSLPEPGMYLIDLEYPNGQSMRTTISLVENQNYVLAVEISTYVPVISSKVKSNYSRVPRVVSSARGKKTTKMELEVSSITQSAQISLSGLFDFATSLKQSGINKIKLFECPQNSELTHEVALLVQPDEQNEVFGFNNNRKWLLVSMQGKPQNLLAYPYGWICENSLSFKLIMGRQSKEKVYTNKWSTSLKLMDPVYGSLVEFLTRRDLFSTLSISESERGKAVTALYQKVGNPYSAAAAAYVFSLTGTEEKKYHYWMEKLCAKYTWLPDSAIALGWKTLREGQNDPEAWDKAKKLFLIACSRGLPYYTVGLHILVDALTLLRQVTPQDSELIEMLAAAKAADVACIRTEPFTTLQLSKYLGLPMRGNTRNNFNV
ncbi:TPA: hypothetical protein IRL93_001784 [Escherichia coli]|nr:hypothetical protein [Escherichia coli]